MSCYKLVLLASENDVDGTLGTTRVEQFRVALDPEKFNAYRIEDSKEAKLLLRALKEAIAEFEVNPRDYS